MAQPARVQPGRADVGARPRSTVPALALVSVVLLALALRGPVSSVGPLLDDLRDDLGLQGAPGALLPALPLLCFAHAARTLRLTTLGILQFLGPTIQFFIGWKLYGEPMTGARLLSFALIWLAVAIYAADAWRRDRSPR